MNERINRERLYRTLTTIDIFVDRALGLKPKSETLSGFNYNSELIYSAVANTYVETIGNKADSLHLAIKRRDIQDIYRGYLETVKVVGRRIRLDEKEVILAFDYTEEDFYGQLENIWIHGGTGQKAVTGKFKFLTCALVCTNAPVKVPLISVPVHVGHNMADTVEKCMEWVEPLLKNILLSLFDRGFYSKELMFELSENKRTYLILVPKNSVVKREFKGMEYKEKKAIGYDYKFNRDKTTLKGSTTLAFLKQIYDKRSDDNYDWAFATNAYEVTLDTLIREYKKRWRIETMFRVQDEAHIMSKSKDIKIRFFYFVYSQVLQLIWATIFKDEIGFKEFLILLNETANERAKKAERRAGYPRAKTS